MKQFFLAASVALLFSCNTGDDFDASLDAQVSKPADPSAAQAKPQPAEFTPAPVLNANKPSVNNTPVLTSAVVENKTPQTPAGKNPPHGQPGHRCDIPVGADLVAPASTGKSTATVQPQNVTVQPTPTSQVTSVKTTVAPGMNPAHGEPGHRCDIAVGAPLNSPATTVQQNKPQDKTDSSGN